MQHKYVAETFAIFPRPMQDNYVADKNLIFFHVRCNIIMLPKKTSIFARPMQHIYVAGKKLKISTSDAT